jgi:predicted LPLAT superfamily acyltransferase
MTVQSSTQEWASRPERGSQSAIRLAVWIALRLGRRAAQVFLYPVCVYFLVSSPAATGSSRAYLERVLGRRPRMAEV